MQCDFYDSFFFCRLIIECPNGLSINSGKMVRMSIRMFSFLVPGPLSLLEPDSGGSQEPVLNHVEAGNIVEIQVIFLVMGNS